MAIAISKTPNGTGGGTGNGGNCPIPMQGKPSLLGYLTPISSGCCPCAGGSGGGGGHVAIASQMPRSGCGCVNGACDDTGGDQVPTSGPWAFTPGSGITGVSGVVGASPLRLDYGVDLSVLLQYAGPVRVVYAQAKYSASAPFIPPPVITIDDEYAPAEQGNSVTAVWNNNGLAALNAAAFYGGLAPGGATCSFAAPTGQFNLIEVAIWWESLLIW